MAGLADHQTKTSEFEPVSSLGLLFNISTIIWWPYWTINHLTMVIFKGQLILRLLLIVTYFELQEEGARSKNTPWTGRLSITGHTPKLNSREPKVRDCFPRESLGNVLTPQKRPRSWIWRMKYSLCSSSVCHVLKLPPFNNFNRWQHWNSRFFAICAKTTFPFLFPVQIWSRLVKTGFSCKGFKGSSKHSVTQISANLGESPTICYFNRRLFFPLKLNM